VRLPRGAVGWEIEWTWELSVNDHGGAEALGVVALCAAGELLRLYRHSCLGEAVTTVHGMGRSTARYGDDAGRHVQRRRHRPAARVSAARPQRAGHVGPGDGLWMAVRCQGRGPQRADRRTEAGLGMGTQRGRGTGDTWRRRGRRVPERQCMRKFFK
jgi:hypothetical protein